MGRGLVRLLMGLGAGAALMYFLDPERGRTRRAQMKDKAVGLSNDARDAISGRAQDISHRASGLLHEARKTISGRSASEEMPTSEVDNYQ